jgi:formylglycine-generating enzyme required for sulfatase activity
LTARWWGDGIGGGNAYCNGCGSQGAANSTSAVGSFAPNPLGLHDMLGSAWQWVEDCWQDNYNNAPGDSSIAVVSGNCGLRVLRGGSWAAPPRSLRAASRHNDSTGSHNIGNGFRVARTPAG